LGKSKVSPKWNGEKEIFEKEWIVPISFGCDHRVLNGAEVAKFSLSWRRYVENPELLLGLLK